MDAVMQELLPLFADVHERLLIVVLLGLVVLSAPRRAAIVAVCVPLLFYGSFWSLAQAAPQYGVSTDVQAQLASAAAFHGTISVYAVALGCIRLIRGLWRRYRRGRRSTA